MKTETTYENSSDFEHGAVPLDKRKSFITITIIWTGFVFVITSMMAGGGLAAGLDFKNLVLATLLGNLFLSVIAMLISAIACRTGLTFALLTRYTFGLKGSRLASLFVPIVNVGWYTIQSAVYGHFIAMIFHCEGRWIEYVCMIASVFIMGAFAYSGVNALSVLGYIAIPAIIYLSIVAAAKSIGMVGGFSYILNYLPSAPISLTSGITIVIGTWILTVASSIADIMRYAKNTKQAVLSAFVGLALGNTLMIISAAIAAIALKQSDLTALLLGMGLVIPSLILMTTNLFTTNAANLYSISLNLANAFNMDRKKSISMVLVVSAVLTLFKPHEIGTLFMLLDISGMVIPPLAGILFADYYLVHRGKYAPLEIAKLVPWKIASWATWIICSVLVYLVDFGLPSLNGIIFAIVLYPLLSKVLDRRLAQRAATKEEAQRGA